MSILSYCSGQVKESGKNNIVFVMRIAFFTPRSIEPLHPRLILFRQYFRNRNIAVDFINRSDYQAKANRINWLTLWFFDLLAIRKCKPLVKDYDMIFINDLRYLPLSKYAKELNKTVIYDTIDHNVFLRFYQLEQKIKIVRPFKFPITSLFKSLEKKYVKKYCDEVLVNSDSLYQYFDQKATTLFYSSPFESLVTKNNSAKSPAMLYLGVFSREKGAVEIIELQKRTNFQLFIFGDVSEPGLLDSIKNNLSITYTAKISIEILTTKLIVLLNNFFLVGFSLIQPAHYSYEVQEANKDIDYLALGIPLIGNQRLPTKEKIEAGCGIYFNDTELAKKMNDTAVRKSMSENCVQYYKKRYASNHFNSKLDAVLSKYLPS